MFRQKGKIITRQRVRVFIEGAQPAVLAKSPLQICYNGLRQKNGGGGPNGVSYTVHFFPQNKDLKSRKIAIQHQIYSFIREINH
jgi:hypothetical protein